MAESVLQPKHRQWSNASNWEISDAAKPILRGRDVSKERLSMKDLRFAVKALSPVCGRWEDIGVAAGVQQLNVTKRKFGNSIHSKMISMISTWIAGQYEPDDYNSNAASWWKIVDVVADEIGGGNPRLAEEIAINWKAYALDRFSGLAKTANGDDLLKLNVPIVIRKLIKELMRVSNKWLEIGTLLGIPLNTLEAFKSQALADGSPISETCLKLVIEEWLSGRYSVDYGYPVPSMMVLVDAIEHPAGGDNPNLAQELVQLQISGLGTNEQQKSAMQLYHGGERKCPLTLPTNVVCNKRKRPRLDSC